MVAKKRIVAALAGVHLLLAAAFAPHIPLEPILPRAVDRPIALYGTFSGVHTHFDFFAPTVATQARVRFSAVSADGASRELTLGTPSAEANNRIAMMLTYFAYPDVRQEMLQALGRYMLRMNAQAVSVEARVELLDIPALEVAARQLARPRWVELDRATVRREDALRP
jgi:hypothetical protein